MAEFLRRRSIDGVETLIEFANAGGAQPTLVYARTLRIEAAGRVHRGWFSAGADQARCMLCIRIDPALAPVASTVLAHCRRLFDLDCRPDAIAAALGALAERRPGLRLPGAVDGFEVAVRAVLGQQITVAAARTLVARVAAAFGEPLATPIPALQRLFPSPSRVAMLSPDALGRLGILSKRAQTIIALARMIDTGRLELTPNADPHETIARLIELPGIGDWTAQYIAMRALSWSDAFPATDYGVMKALGTTKRGEVLARSSGWAPWRAYAVIHLWSSL